MSVTSIALYIIGWGKHTQTRIVPTVSAIGEFYSITIVSSIELAASELSVLFPSQQRPVRAISYEQFFDLETDKQLNNVAWVSNCPVDHRKWIIEAARKGIHVLCEKAMCLKEEDAQACIDASKELYLAEAFMYRHAEYTRWLKSELKSIVGQPHLLNVQFGYYKDDLRNHRLSLGKGGGALNDIGCYGIDFACFLLDEEPVQVVASSIVGAQSQVDEVTSFVLSFARGCCASVSVSTRVEPVNQIEVIGTDGSIKVEDAFLCSNDYICVLITKNGKTLTKKFENKNHYRLQLERFIEQVINKKNNSLFDDGLRTARYLEKVRKSAWENRQVLHTDYMEIS